MLKEFGNIINELAEIMDNLGELAIKATGLITLVQLLVELVVKGFKKGNK